MLLRGYASVLHRRWMQAEKVRTGQAHAELSGKSGHSTLAHSLSCLGYLSAQWLVSFRSRLRVPAAISDHRDFSGVKVVWQVRCAKVKRLGREEVC